MHYYQGTKQCTNVRIVWLSVVQLLQYLANNDFDFLAFPNIY